MLCLLCQLPWCSWLCRENCRAEVLLGVVCAHVGHCWGTSPPWTFLQGIQVPASAVGTVGQEQEFLLISWRRVCLMHHIAGCYSQLRCSPKCQRPTLRCCSAISPRGLCRALVHRQQQNMLRAQGDLGFIRLQIQEPVSGSIQCVFSSLCQFPLRWLSLAGAAAPLQLRARGRG